MEITPKDQLLLAELEKAINNEKELLPIRDEINRNSYSSRQEAYNTILQLTTIRADLLTNLAALRLSTLKAATRLTQ